MAVATWCRHCFVRATGIRTRTCHGGGCGGLRCAMSLPGHGGCKDAPRRRASGHVTNSRPFPSLLLFHVEGLACHIDQGSMHMCQAHPGCWCVRPECFVDSLVQDGSRLLRLRLGRHDSSHDTHTHSYPSSCKPSRSARSHGPKSRLSGSCAAIGARR